MKVYIVGGSEEEIQKVERICQENGWEFRLMGRIGRPPVDYPVQKVLDAYGEAGSIRGTAKIVGLSPGSVQRVLKCAGALGQAGESQSCAVCQIASKAKQNESAH